MMKQHIGMANKHTMGEMIYHLIRNISIIHDNSKWFFQNISN